MGDAAMIFLMMLVAVVLSTVLGVLVGVRVERDYQCEQRGGQMAGSSLCVKSSEVLIRWP